VASDKSRDTQGRTLKTARAVLQALRLLGERPGGVTADEVAEVLGKSHSTATYLVNSLVEEGFATRQGVGSCYRYRLDSGETPWADTLQASRPGELGTRSGGLGRHHASAAPGPNRAERGDRPAPSPRDLEAALEELYARTGQRSYLAAVAEHAVVILRAKGRQGLATVPGLSATIRGEAHAVAIGKIFLAAVATETFSDALASGHVPSFTPATITEPALLKVELARVRSRGYALDEEEFVEGICCVAAPVFGEAGRLVATLGVSVPTFRFKADRERLIQAVTDVARVVSVPSAVISTNEHQATEEAM
jgi:DNA-binding IclR family transcriptional regulator